MILLLQRSKNKDTGDKDEFDVIEEGAQKSVASRVGNSPNQIGKQKKRGKVPTNMFCS